MKIKLQNEDYVFLLCAILILALNYNFVSQLKQIPSPIYGGDLYNGLGGVMHLYDGGDLFSSAQSVGEIPWVPWLYHLLIVIFAKISGLSPMLALINFSLVLLVCLLVLIYFLMQKLTDKSIAILMTILFAPLPLFKYSDFSTWVVVPFFALCLGQFHTSKSLKTAIFMGIALGAMGLSNTQSFFLGFLIFFIYLFVFNYKNILLLLKSNKINEIKEHGLFLRPYIVALLVGILLSMLFWFWPIFVFKGKTLNPIQDITSPDMRNPTYLWGSISDEFTAFLFPDQSDLGIVFTIFSLYGLYCLYKDRKEDKNKFIWVFVLAFVIVVLHPLFTLPLFNIHLVNFMMADRLRPILRVFLIGIGVFSAGIRFDEKKKLALIGCLVILAAFELQTAFATSSNDRWANVGKTSLSPAYLELTDWVRSNTNVNDVFIATNEDSFMFNALTGRKTVVYRLTHASPYSDMYGRMRDQAAIVYGNNDNERSRLLQKYNVKYVLWTAYWLPNEFRFDNEGHVVGFVDPLLVPSSSDYSSYWNSNGVKYIQNKMTPDPAPRIGVPLYNLLVAYPPSPSMDQPYSSDFAKHLKLVKEIQEQGHPFFRIYKVDTN